MRIVTAVGLACAISYGQSLASESRQPQQTESVIRISVNLVQLDAVVTDSKGRQVTDLTPEDFEILQDGKQQAITNLNYVRTAPDGGVPAPPATAKDPRNAPPPVPVNLKPEQVRRTILGGRRPGNVIREHRARTTGAENVCR